jgi:hypothetical protein
MGFAYIKLGANQLGVESHCSWGVPGRFTAFGNYPCFEDGKNCAEVKSPAGAFLAEPAPHFFQDARNSERAAALFVQEEEEGEMGFLSRR